jgi:flavin reductase (DIM6/NTAB) family NADH-FMN oxidoreductase RutF/DNA-binding FadR family transcriptional regulator
VSTSSSESDQPRRLTSEEFRDVIGHFASGVTVITTTAHGRPAGTTASAVASLSLEPPMVLISMNQASSTGKAIAESGWFAINILGEEHGDLAMRFAKKGEHKFDGVATHHGRHVGPLLDDALAHLECRVTEQVVAGTHVVFIAEVLAASARPGEPLAYFRGRFGRLELATDTTIHEDLRARVLRPDAAGERLDVDELAEELRVSRGPVFHGLSKLAEDGLLAREPDGSFAVRDAPTSSSLADAYAARRAIELGVVDLTVGRVTPQQVATLRRLMEATDELIEGDRFVDVDRWIEANAAFHEYMVGLAGSESLVRSYRRLGLSGLNAHALRAGIAADRVLVDDHRRLVEAYERGDVDLARRVVAEHTGRPAELSAAAAAR